MGLFSRDQPEGMQHPPRDTGKAAEIARGSSREDAADAAAWAAAAQSVTGTRESAAGGK